MHSRCLKYDRRSTPTGYAVDLTAIKRNDLALLSFDVGAGDEGNFGSQRLPSPTKDRSLIILAEIVDVPGVHIDGIGQARALSGSKMFLKCPDGDSSVRFERQ